MSALINFVTRRLLPKDSTDDHFGGHAETEGLLNSLYINLVLFAFFMVFFEANRHMKSTYLKRATKKFKRSNRVPPCPSNYPLAWISTVMAVGDEDLLRMVGLDGYMLIRYISVCFRMSVFYSLWGVFVLAPLYSNAGTHISWSKYTLANIPNSPSDNQLWTPAVFAYIFSIYFCHLMYSEYKNFVLKRNQYLIQGDPDTPSQTYYTLMVEKIPTTLRSAPALEAFFEKLFPGSVYSVEVALDLTELEMLTEQRRNVRDALEKSIALWKATGQRPSKWIHKNDPTILADPQPSVADSISAHVFNFIIIDKIIYLSQQLKVLNESVRVLQIATFHQRQIVDEQETERQQNVHGKIEAHATLVAGKFLSSNVKSFQSVTQKMTEMFRLVGGSILPAPVTADADAAENSRELLNGEEEGPDYDVGVSSSNISASTPESLRFSPSIPSDTPSAHSAHPKPSLLTPASLDGPGPITPLTDPMIRPHIPARVTVSLDDLEGSTVTPVTPPPTFMGKSTSCNGLHAVTAHKRNVERTRACLITHDKAQKHPDTAAMSMMNLSLAIGDGVGGLAQEGIKTASIATRGALRGVLEGIRAVELLTVGAYYKTSSTAFVTMSSHQATITAHQLFLSHVHYSMVVKSAPNPKDCIWENISIPLRQITMRRAIADGTLIVGAVFWSIVVGFITAISNLELISKELPWISTYRNTVAYQVLNGYLAVALLLVLLSILPVIFDLIARYYEGLKLESEIQNSIMTRYFYYQLANVFVSVGLGSLASSIHLIIENPSSVLSILGSSLPSLSVYFTNLLIVKTFTAMPLELLRVWPLLQILQVRMCRDRSKCTVRELKKGAFANPTISYGWIYPNLLMVLMIVCTYCCIAPLLCPFGMIFYGFAYLMYKYQLLFVYINEYQSGGYMWYAVFNGSMVALIAGVLTLLGYLGIRETFFSGPFYLLAPLPLCLSYFWYKCEDRFKSASTCLSLESAIDLDKEEAQKVLAGLSVPHRNFRPALFRQPSLAEGSLAPQAYRKVHSFSSPNRVPNPYNESRDNTPTKDRNPYKKLDPYDSVSVDSPQVEAKYSGGYSPVKEEDIDDSDNSTTRYQDRLNHEVNRYFASSSSSRRKSIDADDDVADHKGNSKATKVPFTVNITPINPDRMEAGAGGVSEEHRQLHTRSAHTQAHPHQKLSFAENTVDNQRSHEGRNLEGPRSDGTFSWIDGTVREEEEEEDEEEEGDEGEGSDGSDDEMDFDVNEILDFSWDRNDLSRSNSRSGRASGNRWSIDTDDYASVRMSPLPLNLNVRGQGMKNGGETQLGPVRDRDRDRTSLGGKTNHPPKTAGLSHVEDGIGAGSSTSTSTGPPPNPYGFTSLFQPSSKLDSTLASPLLASPHNGDDNNDDNDDADSNNNNNGSTRNSIRNNSSSAEQKNRPKGWSFFRRYGSTDDMDTPP